MNKRYKCLFVCAVTLGLSACATTSPGPSASLLEQQRQQSQLFQQSLDQAAISTAYALEQLSALQKAQYPENAKMPFANDKTKALKKLVYVNWYGPIEPVLKQVADAVNYKLQVYGKTPVTPILVDINDTNKVVSAIEIVRNLDLQAGSQASVILYKKQKIISLRYNGRDSS